MKTITCKQLGGACDLEFKVETFEEVMELSKQHGMEMFQKGDAAHMEAIQKMMQLMQSQDQMTAWLEQKKKEFEALPDS